MVMKKIITVGLLALCGISVSGCITSSPEQLLSPVGANQPLGQAQNTGEFANVRNRPEPATNQLSSAEVAQAKSELTRDAAPSAAQASQNNQAIYKNEVTELQNLAKQQKLRRLQEIESRKF